MRDKLRPEIIKSTIGALTGIIGLLAAIITLVLGTSFFGDTPTLIGRIIFATPTLTLATPTPTAKKQPRLV